MNTRKKILVKNNKLHIDKEQIRMMIIKIPIVINKVIVGQQNKIV